MILSRYTLFTAFNPDRTAVFNPLSGAFDLADEEEVQALKTLTPRTEHERKYWLDRGYVFENKTAEETYLGERYQEFLSETSTGEIQILLVFSYACNFNCFYCYQKGVPEHSKAMTLPMIENALELITRVRDEKKRPVYVTLFGGEPLLPAYRDRLEKLIARLNQEQISLSVVSNGYYLEDYLDLLSTAKIREIQVTLDGNREIHDQRRQTRDGNHSFERIIRASQKALTLGLPVHFRLITDKETLPTFPALAEFLKAEGFFNYSAAQFKTSLGRNYELIDRPQEESILYELDEMLEAYARLMGESPALARLHTPSFFGVTQLVNHGEMYLPNFDTCPAGKSEFVLDASGNIFGCTASCGRDGYELGTFYPEIQWNPAALKEWKNRNIFSIPGCTDCDVALMCGGGCGVIAKDRNGSALTQNCKPVKKVMDTGIRYYAPQILQKLQEN